jgi:hypothetical protein
VDNPFGFTIPFSVAAFAVMFVAAFVIAVGTDPPLDVLELKL